MAVLGPSGAGKSTLAAMALKVVAPQQGSVRLGGVDLATLSAAEVHARFAWLSQATHLFDDTIRANLLLARPEADEAALWSALDAARIGETVRALPDRLDTWVGEGGTQFSGGQGRRLALALYAVVRRSNSGAGRTVRRTRRRNRACVPDDVERGCRGPHVAADRPPPDRGGTARPDLAAVGWEGSGGGGVAAALFQEQRAPPAHRRMPSAAPPARMSYPACRRAKRRVRAISDFSSVLRSP